MKRDYARPIFRSAGISGQCRRDHPRQMIAASCPSWRMASVSSSTWARSCRTEAPNELIDVIAHEGEPYRNGGSSGPPLRPGDPERPGALHRGRWLLGGAGKAVGASRSNVGTPGAGVAGIVRRWIRYCAKDVAGLISASRGNGGGPGGRGGFSMPTTVPRRHDRSVPRFADEAMFGSNLDPYMMSPPPSRCRRSALAQLRATRRAEPAPPQTGAIFRAQLQARHRSQARAKIFGFVERARKTVLRRYSAQATIRSPPR